MILLFHLLHIIALSIFSLTATHTPNKKIPCEMLIAYESGASENITQGLMQSGSGIHAVTGTILNGLYQGAAPAVISAGLYKNIYAHAQIFKEALTLSDKKFFELYGVGARFNSLEKVSAFKKNSTFAYTFYTTLKDQIIKAEATNYIQLERHLKNAISLKSIALPAAFEESDIPSMVETYLYLQAYIVMEESYKYCLKKELVEPIYILISKNYKKNLMQHDAASSNPLNCLGLQSADLEIPDQSDLDKVMPLQDIEVKKASFIKGIKQLFIRDKKYSWSILLIGHGMFKQESSQSNCIASFDTKEFQQLLHFFNDAITTNCFYYKSCYAGGMNFIEGFKDKATGNQLAFNYLIASDATTEAPVMNFVGMIPINLHILKNPAYGELLQEAIDLDTKEIKLINTFDYKKFFELLAPADHSAQDWYSIFRCINGLCAKFDWMVNEKTGRFDTKYFADVLSIRIPGQTSFMILDHNEICQLDTDTTSVNSNTQVLFLTQPTLATITTDSDCFPACISKIAGPSAHSIDHIQAERASIFQIACSFLPLEDLASSKMFTIKSATCINDFAHEPGQQTVTFTNLLFFNNILHKDKKINGFIAQLNDRIYHYSYPHDQLISSAARDKVEIITNDRELRKEYIADFAPKMRAYSGQHILQMQNRPIVLSLDSFTQKMLRA